MTARFDTVTLVGVGLLGGSLGLALKRRSLANKVLGVGHRQTSLEKALNVGAIDAAFIDLQEAAPKSDLLVICTPAATVPDFLDQLRPLCSRDAVVTDVASTKAEICAHMRKAWAEPYRFIGSHPMAGSEKFGPEHATPDLYNEQVCFVEALNGHDERAHQSVVDLWEAVGARVEFVSPERHDALVAKTSHVPHVAASILATLLANEENAAPFVGAGFRDTTRIAEGRPEVWRDICLTNSDAIRSSLSDVRGEIDGFLDALDRRDGDALYAFFDRARNARRDLLSE